ncbi:hypothetical protein JKP88DRAFT_233731 [Tribonema minus]|uniref:Mediator of RNA polymerase II transcription subunit 10 n=1 Tax=Tribonema minus TaxID=303371 RepID=A0A835Z750_9STRA|nr:hypothetical protein JKP88DRAFT_233731 [Tribonema minus]
MVDVVLTLDELENRIENFVEEKPLFSQINAYVDKLQALSDARETCDADVPVQALERLDNNFNNNPEVFSLELLQRCRAEFDAVRNKAEGIRQLREGVADWRGGGGGSGGGGSGGGGGGGGAGGGAGDAMTDT